MNTNRRSFLKKAAVTAPGVALIGAVPGFAEAEHTSDINALSYQEQLDNGWLNVRECGASGSIFQTTAATKSGSRQITVSNVGDFKVGQGVMVSKCNIRYTPTRLQSHGIPYTTTSRPLNNSVEVRGYDGSSGSWIIYILEYSSVSETSLPVDR